MTKRHTKQSHKQKNGQFFTTNADHILSGFEDVVKNKIVIDPFVGGKDLLIWAKKNGAVKTIGYDLEPISEDVIKNDSITNPPSYDGMILVTNPPYLSKNKFKGDKTIFEMWGQNDLYKCHLASLKPQNCQEAIIILPSNFLCESSHKARELLFSDYQIMSAKYWNTPVFEDATTGICVIHIQKRKCRNQEFDLIHVSENKTFNMMLESKYNYLYGKDFFDYISLARGDLKLIKTDYGMEPPNTNIVVGLLDNGKWQSGISYNDGAPIYCAPKSFTTYQLTIENLNLSNDQQKHVVEVFNEKFNSFRKKYHDMFLSNYMGPKQKILSRYYVHRFFEVVVSELKYYIPDASLEKFFKKFT